MKEKQVIAACISDLHLWQKAPVARSVEEDWIKTQARYLAEVNAIISQKGIPLIVGGDIFDRYNPSPECINLALTHLPNCYAVPGQHDLKCHVLEDIACSAFWTLVQAGKVTYLEPNRPVEIPSAHPMRLWGFPWGCDLHPLKKPSDLLLEVAVIHKYIYGKNSGYPGAPKDKSLGSYKEVLTGYDIALFGDNHKRVTYNLKKDKDGPSIFNPGSFIRRKMDELNHAPCMGMIYSDGSIEPHYLNTNEDKFLDVEVLVKQMEERGNDSEEFIEELLKLSDAAISFRDAVKQVMFREGASPEMVRIICRAMGE